MARFHTAVPDALDRAFWSRFWERKLPHLSREGVMVYSRSLRYRSKRVRLPEGGEQTYPSGEEKRTGLRIALHVLRRAYTRDYDVARVFGQDQDLSEVAAEIRAVAEAHDRWIEIA